VADIRPLERDDIPQVASLYEHVARSGSRAAPRGLGAYFAETFLDHPWFDPEIPSLVYQEQNGTIAGFLGSSVRRLLFDGSPIRACVSGQVVTEPRIRSQAAGAFLMRACLEGPQDLTLTDGASTVVEHIWARLGGEAFQIACVGWLRVFRPALFAVDLAAIRRKRHALGSANRSLARILDAATSRVPGRLFRPPRSDALTEPLTPRGLAEHIDEVAAWTSVRPDYDEAFLKWLFREMAAVTERGRLVCRLIRDPNRVVQGWYVYYLVPGRIGHVLQIAATEHGVETVVEHLLHDAWSGGAAALQGRLEAHLREPLARRRCIFHGGGSLALVHSRDHRLLHAIQSGRSLLTRMEGEWWMGHHLQPFEETADYEVAAPVP
jgi:hypothetical protein